MKKLFTLFVILFATTVGLHAQSTNLTQAVDFTATDCHGNEIHLFDILDRGRLIRNNSVLHESTPTIYRIFKIGSNRK